MRTLLFVILALGVAASGFFAYLRTQGPSARDAAADRDARAAYDAGLIDRDAETAGDVGPGRRPWIKVTDREGRLQYRFRADDFAPRGGGRVDVRDVEAEFFQYVKLTKDPADARTRTQRVQILGKSGFVEVQEGPRAAPGGGFEKGAGGGPPKRGVLNDVTIRIFPDFRSDWVSVTATCPNVAFDNESYEIRTREYRAADGTLVPADQVPVRATGDYAFDGRGMTLRWNDVDGRLEFLEIAHGNYLVVNDPELLSQAGPEDGSRSRGLGAGGQKAVSSSVDSISTPSYGLPAASFNPLTREPLRDARGEPIRLTAADPKAAARAGRAAKPQPAKPARVPQPPYRATFNRDVRVSQGERDVRETEVARADVMHVEFGPGSGGSTTKPATRRTRGAAAEAAGTAPAVTAPGSDVPVATAEPGAPVAPDRRGRVPVATKPAATRPATQPVIVRWSGPLRVVPMDALGEVPPTLGPGESAVRLVGTAAPVRLARELSRVTCATAEYFSADGSARLRGSGPHGPVVVHQLPDPAARGGSAQQQATIVTQQLDYAGTDRVATLHGQSTAHVVLPADDGDAAPATRPASGPSLVAVENVPAATRPTQALDARWARQGRLFLKPGLAGGDALTIDRAEFEGDVDVRHPQLALRSQKLELAFDERLKPSTRPATSPATAPAKLVAEAVLTKVVATTDVWCDLTDEDGRSQTVTTDRLALDAARDAAGKLYPRLVTATGNAHARDGQQDLRAGNLELTLAPADAPASRPAGAAAAKPPAVGLQSMRAWDQVAVRSADGATIAGDRMDVRMAGGHPVARVTGAPLATVTDPAGSSITGPVIDVDGKRQWAKVTGRGSIRAMRAEPAAKAATRPMTTAAATKPAASPKFDDFYWEREAVLDGAANRITVAGPVLVTSVDPDGTRNSATGQQAIVELADKPAGLAAAATRPSTKPSKAGTRPSALPGLASGGGMDPLKDKVVKGFELQQKAAVTSTLSDAGGILQQFEIRSDRLRYEAGDPPAGEPAAPATKPAANSPLAAGGDGRLVVPGPGVMIYRDHRPPTATTKPAAAAAGRPGQPPKPASPAPDQARGATAFQWQERMTYDQSARKATMLTGVVIVHRPDEPGGQQVEVRGDRVEALFEPKPAGLAKPATRPAAGGGDPAAAADLQLKWLAIRGSVRMDRAGSTLTADRADYDPATEWVVAVGTRAAAAAFTTPATGDTMLADEIHWNARTWQTAWRNLRGRTGAANRPVVPAGR